VTDVLPAVTPGERRRTEAHLTYWVLPASVPRTRPRYGAAEPRTASRKAPILSMTRNTANRRQD